MTMRVFLFIMLCIAGSLSEEILKVTAGDSYLEAYKESKSASAKTENKAEKKSDNGYPVYPGPLTEYGQPDSYGPSTPQYGPPSPQYGPPSSQYGPATPQYGPPAPQYGPPIPQYGPPTPPPMYGSFGEPVPQYGPPVYGPPAQNLQVFYGMPHAMISIWDKLWEKIKFKLNLFTIGKIILKLIIFKKIVSLIAILCLLLFIPSLKHKKLSLFHGDNEGERSIQTRTLGDESINALSAFAIEAIENYTNLDKKNVSTCDTTYCRAKKLVNKLDNRI